MSSVLSAADVAATADWIAGQQHASGAIAWSATQHLDPWDHTQAAMGLVAAGRLAEAERAYDWLAGAQRPDGSWAARYVADGHGGLRVDEDHLDTNFTAYIATGVWHHWLVTSAAAFVERLWPTVDAALARVLEHRCADGAVAWTTGTDEALVAGNASIQFSLRCGAALAAVMGLDRPAWIAAADGIRAVFARTPERFSPKPHSMDWYYPLLGGPAAAITGPAAQARIDEGWARFVVPELGVRCVTPNPWVTGAETCELVLALDAAGRCDEAALVLASMQHLRESDGAYWTGYEFVEQVRWPDEQTTWTAATVLLAHDALTRGTGGSGLFRGEGIAV